MSANINDVIAMMKDTNMIKSDVTRAANVVRDMFEEKYAGRIKDAICYHQTKACENPSKEITLIQALKNFMPPGERQRADALINAMSFADTMNSMRGQFANNIENTSIHDDGVYDIDDQCVCGKTTNNALGLILLLSAMNKA
jgi:hypothetical protein